MNIYDSFVSYASEDEKFASELVGALRSRGFDVWYAPSELKIGEKLLDSIESGMNKSKSSILLISKEYLDKGWTNYELDTLIRQHIEEKKKIFPIRIGLANDEVRKRHAGLAGIISLSIDVGFSSLVEKLAEALADNAPTIGKVPIYESPVYRFLSGRGEITISPHNKATTLWEFLIHAKHTEYPLYLAGNQYNKKDLLLRAAQLLPHIPDEVRNWVEEKGRQKIWNMCVDAGLNPQNFE